MVVKQGGKELHMLLFCDLQQMYRDFIPRDQLHHRGKVSSGRTYHYYSRHARWMQGNNTKIHLLVAAFFMWDT